MTYSPSEPPLQQDFLARYRDAMRPYTRKRGSLRVFLGAAPGVGKTYAMLREGRRLKAEGHDVVIGFVETHGRVETEREIGDLEIVPRKRLVHRGVTIEEMDTEAILRRAPEIVLVDELAHTNAPGSLHAKRWQDVEMLRDAGIDVLTTLNIQHLESLTDVVENITGVRVHETVPDHILDDADVQLVDLPVGELVERLEQGKIYPGPVARRALQNFFRSGNLIALRELALRRTAAGVEEQLERYMRQHAIPDVWPAAERVVALVTPHPATSTVIRHAWRLADGLQAELLAIVVTPNGRLNDLPERDQAQIQRHLRVAEDLGATVQMIAGTQPSEAIASFVREKNASIIVIGYAARHSWFARIRPSLLDDLLLRLDNVDIYVVELKSRSHLPDPTPPGTLAEKIGSASAGSG